ncbi:MAG: hypothetical protein AAGA29_10710 [Planctomycetota bacterium]
MRHGSKLLILLPTLLVCLLLCGTAAADEALAGAWELSQFGDNEPEDGQRVVYAFGESTVQVTIESSGTSASWELAYSVSDGKLTIEPGEGLGDPAPVTYVYTVEEDVLTLQQEAEEGRAEPPKIVFARPAE